VAITDLKSRKAQYLSTLQLQHCYPRQASWFTIPHMTKNTQPKAGELLAKRLIHQLSPARWLAEECNLRPDPWQADILKVRGTPQRGARVAALAVRQSGKSQIAAGRAAHTALFKKDRRGGPTLSLIAAPAERQGQLLLARAAELLDLGDHIEQRSQSRLLLKNGGQIIALPMGSDAGATARGFTVSGVAILDEVGFLPDAQEVMSVIAPMCAIHGADMMLISSASFEGDHWHKISVQGEGNWERFRITMDMCPRLTPEIIDDLRGQLGPALFAREMELQFSAEGFSPISLEAMRACADDTQNLTLDPMELMLA
jgi:hypothetical protein